MRIHKKPTSLLNTEKPFSNTGNNILKFSSSKGSSTISEVMGSSFPVSQ